MKLQKFISGLAVSLLFFSASKAETLKTYSLEWSGAGFENSATAFGHITFDMDVFSNFNDGDEYFQIPAISLGIIDFSITISGAAFGDGTYELIDFDAFAWDSGESPLDLNSELVGQNDWGNDDEEGGFGDFNVFGETVVGFNYFTISVGNEGLEGESSVSDLLVLTSFAPAAVPEPSAFAAIAGLGALGFVGVRRRRS